MRWSLGLTIGFVVMIGVNMLLIYLAVSDTPEIVESYQTEAR